MSGLDWQGQQRSWTPTGDLGFTLAAIDQARAACAVGDVYAAWANTELALTCVQALHHEAYGWEELADVERAWIILRSAIVSQVDGAMLHNVIGLAAARLAALRERLMRVAADRAEVEAMEAAMSEKES